MEKSLCPDPDFYCCEFVGFLNKEETLVGCMLHPFACGNAGTDWRGLSFHGAMACQGFYCRSYRELSTMQKEIILFALNDWFLYGLVISNADFIRRFFRLVEENSIDPATLLTVAASRLVREFFHSLGPLDSAFVSPCSTFLSPPERNSSDERVNNLFSRLKKVV